MSGTRHHRGGEPLLVADQTQKVFRTLVRPAAVDDVYARADLDRRARRHPRHRPGPDRGRRPQRRRGPGGRGAEFDPLRDEVIT